MISAPLPENEAERLAALKRHEILDSIPEQSCDDLLAVAALGTKAIARQLDTGRNRVEAIA